MTAPEGLPLRCDERCVKVTSDGICPWCSGRLEREIGEYAALWGQLDPAPGSATSSRSTGKPGSRPPLNLGVVDEQVEARDVLASWARMFAEERNLHGPKTWDVVAVCRWMSPWLPTMARQPWADDFAAEVHERVRAMRGMTGARALVHHLPAPCPACDCMGLVRRDGSDHVECEACTAVWDEASYRRLTVVLAAELGETA